MRKILQNSIALRNFLWVVFAIVMWSSVFWGMVKISPKIPNPGEVSPIFWSTSYLALLSGIVLVGTTLYLIDRWIKASSSVPVLFGMTLILAAFVHYTNQLSHQSTFTALLIDICLIGIGCHIGKIVAMGVSQRSYLIPLTLVASVTDLWSVWGGPTHVIVREPLLQNYFLITYPLLGSNAILPTLGLGDITFLALYFALLPQYKLKVRATSWAIIFAFSAVFLLSLQAGKGLPAIPFISAAFLAVNWKQLEFKKEDVQTTFIFIGVFFIIAFLFTKFAH
jgi:hypothetical protein